MAGRRQRGGTARERVAAFEQGLVATGWVPVPRGRRLYEHPTQPGLRVRCQEVSVRAERRLRHGWVSDGTWYSTELDAAHAHVTAPPAARPPWWRRWWRRR